MERIFPGTDANTAEASLVKIRKALGHANNMLKGLKQSKFPNRGAVRRLEERIGSLERRKQELTEMLPKTKYAYLVKTDEGDYWETPDERLPAEEYSLGNPPQYTVPGKRKFERSEENTRNVKALIGNKAPKRKFAGPSLKELGVPTKKHKGLQDDPFKKLIELSNIADLEDRPEVQRLRDMRQKVNLTRLEPIVILPTKTQKPGHPPERDFDWDEQSTTRTYTHTKYPNMEVEDSAQTRRYPMSRAGGKRLPKKDWLLATKSDTQIIDWALRKADSDDKRKGTKRRRQSAKYKQMKRFRGRSTGSVGGGNNIIYPNVIGRGNYYC